MLKRVELEDWFARNLRGHEAIKQTISKDLIKENTNVHTKMKLDAKTASKLMEHEVDPHFCKAYGVQYNPDRGTEVFLSSARQDELDNEFGQYLEACEPKKINTEDGEEEEGEETKQVPDVLRKAKEKAKAEQDSSFDSEDQALRQKHINEQLKKHKNKGQEQEKAQKDVNALLSKRDDLKIKAMAKYRCVQDGDIHMFSEIENQMLDMATIKGKAFDDSELMEEEFEILDELSDRGLNNPDNNFGRQSGDSEALHSVRSSEDYWQNLLDQRQKRTRTLHRATTKNDEEQRLQAQRRLQHQRYDDLGKKMEQMKKSHEIELRTLRKTSRKAGLDFFK